MKDVNVRMSERGARPNVRLDEPPRTDYSVSLNLPCWVYAWCAITNAVRGRWWHCAGLCLLRAVVKHQRKLRLHVEARSTNVC
jgi:hypothetical protein